MRVAIAFPSDFSLKPFLLHSSTRTLVVVALGKNLKTSLRSKISFPDLIVVIVCSCFALLLLLLFKVPQEQNAVRTETN